jgi:hypothetical protein
MGSSDRLVSPTFDSSVWLSANVDAAVGVGDYFQTMVGCFGQSREKRGCWRKQRMP